MYIIIVGCGRTGSNLANLLSQKGEEVVVLDKNSNAFDDLSPVFTGFAITGNATEMSFFKRSKPEKADVLIAVTDDDSVNSMVAQIAKEIYDIPKVIVKINEPNRKVYYKNHDIIEISSTEILVDHFMEKLSED